MSLGHSTKEKLVESLLNDESIGSVNKRTKKIVSHRVSDFRFRENFLMTLGCVFGAANGAKVFGGKWCCSPVVAPVAMNMSNEL